MSRRGAFIVIEGLDRSGKSTQAALLRKTLQENGHNVVLIKFPDRTTPIGQMIDSYLRSQSNLDDHTIHLLFSANRWELAATIESHLTAGAIVICDRYAFSGVVFSAAKGLPYEWCRSPDILLPAPDLTLFLDLAPEVASTRGGYGLERYEKEELQSRVRMLFGRIGAEMGTSWVKIDAGGTLNDVQREIWAKVQKILERTQSSVSRLWEDVLSEQ